MQRSYDANLLSEAVLRCPTWDKDAGFDVDYWLSIPENLMLEEDGNVGLLTFEYTGVYNGHWFFNIRGKEAKDLANRMLGYCFEHHDARAVRGLTPISLVGARWLAKKLGFKPYGTIEYSDREPEELMILTKKDYEALNNGT